MPMTCLGLLRIPSSPNLRVTLTYPFLGFKRVSLLMTSPYSLSMVKCLRLSRSYFQPPFIRSELSIYSCYSTDVGG